MTDSSAFIFTAANFKDPKLPSGLQVLDVPLLEATEENLALVGASLISGPDERSCANGNFEIVKWPVKGWRQLDPNTGDEAGTTEGDFQVHWEGDYFFGHNLGIATSNNYYLDGLSALPEDAKHVKPNDSSSSYRRGEAEQQDATVGQQQEEGEGNSSRGGGADSSTSSPSSSSSPSFIYLWMSDYHPDGGQLFWNHNTSVPFVCCLGPASAGDDIKPTDMRAFSIPPGKGCYFPPGTWHNGVYTHPSFVSQTFLTRQGKVHARVSCSWASEFKTLLRVPLAK